MIDSSNLNQTQVFKPSAEFRSQANISDESIYKEAESDFESFWARQARELLTWSKDFTQTLKWESPDAEWFADGQLNASYNCLDRHIESGLGDRVAYYWEGEPGDTKTITYNDLFEQVCKFANVLKSFGLEKGDSVAIYLPMIPELPIAMLACARIGVVHSVIFGGFSADAIIDRCEDAQAKLIVTADGGFRKGKASALKPTIDDALNRGADTVEQVIVVNRCELNPAMVEGRDHRWDELMEKVSKDCPAEPMDAEQLLYLLYTSGTTAKPKGIMHTTGGYLTQAAFTHKYVFDIKPESDIYWCAADIGWVTGHSYIVYGPLLNGCTSVMYEGAPTTPTEDRFWDIIEKYKITQLYTAPTAIRMFMKCGEAEPQKHDLSSLRVLGSVGEPINPEAWLWYHKYIGNESTPIVDTWWQTETGANMITPLPGLANTKPGSACKEIPGVFAEVVTEDGRPAKQGEEGLLVFTKPWPSMLRGIWNDRQRYQDTYWSRFPGKYFSGDAAKIDEDGYIWLLGRVDDVMNISGHRISTAEVESALVEHPAVVEAAVVGADDELTGQAIVAYTILKQNSDDEAGLAQTLREHVGQKLGKIARPKSVVIVPELPKTRSGKIMRRILKKLANNQETGDTTTLEDPTIVEVIKSKL